jgi:DHA1 family bicyclomycin/chloramphenicol resistance-like MFS transporter
MTTEKNRKISIVLMVLLLFATQACTDIFLSGLPMIAKEFGATMEVTNLTISIYNYSQAVVVLFIGVISDLRGRRATILTCLALHIGATIWIALSSSISWIIIMRVLQATGSAAVYIILRLIIKDTMDKKAQIHATGLLVVGLVLSPILAPVLGAWIIHLSGWRNCFWAIALFEAPLFAWAWMTISETNHKQAAFRSSFRLKNHFLSYVAVLQERYFLGMALIVGSVFAAFYAFISISSYLYINQFGMQQTSYAYVFIGIAVSYLIGNRLMSKLNADNLPPQRIIGLGISVSLVGAACILGELVTRHPLVIIALITLGTCLLRLATALINPPAQVVVTNHFHERGSHALGMLTCVQYSFAAIGTMVVSGLPLTPSGNFMFSTSLFVALSLVGYLFAFKRTAAVQLS